VQQSPKHSVARGVPVGGGVALLLRRFTIQAAAAALALSSGGCSVSYPIGSMMPQSDDVTGSIKPRPGDLRDEEDRRRAKAALATALDPQGAGTVVTWANPASGNKGSYKPSGPAYPADGGICRPFVEAIVQDGAATETQGKACAGAGSADWVVSGRKELGKS
jgi:surface antigen